VERDPRERSTAVVVVVLTGRAAALALLAAGLVGGLVAAGLPAPASLLLVNASLGAVIAVDVGLAARPGDLALARSGERRVRLGQTAVVALSATNTGTRRWRGGLRDAWPPTAGATVAGGTDRVVLDLAPGDSARLPVEVRPTRRGDRRADRVTLRPLGPLGIAGRQRSVRVDWSVRTLPPFSSRRHLPSRLARLRDMDGRQAIAVRAQGTEFDSLREYVPGDDVRSIDWRATARAADVMVRTWRPERDRRVVLVLDSGRTSAARIGDETRLDILIDAALLLAALAGRAGDRVEVLAHDRRTRLQVGGSSGSGQLAELVDGLATLEPELTETDHRGLVSTVLSRVGKRALVVLLTSLDRPAMEEGLLPALTALTARHTVVVASVRTPATGGGRTGARGSAVEGSPGPADGPGGGRPRGTPGGPAGGSAGDGPRTRIDRRADRADATTTYQRAAEARSELDRAAVGARLARLGARVVDAGPAELAPRLADAYLDLKAVGRL